MSHDPYFNRPQPPQMPQHPRFDDRPQGGSKLPWILGAIGGVVLLGVLVCCGGGYALVNLGMNVVAEDIRMQLRDHPTVREHIGEIESIDTAFGASLAHEDDDTFVYNVSGDKGDGELTVKSVTGGDGMEDIVSATLRTDDGETYELDL
ncbi:Coa1/Tim21 domain-containing protein [Roseimaritima ulvae]|uniref:Cytochrome oxidase complex assembly protein 1 n=1 Tax=Roseimaritima ulvae TaxID=980254 RepID=A0A5B9R6M1_9BACT|nr:hypothetical protein [Roseimaritima ulvae]QEG41953.1 hypothetical protein UC8_39820 [Roseimaritima ulvae]